MVNNLNFIDPQGPRDTWGDHWLGSSDRVSVRRSGVTLRSKSDNCYICLLYTSDAADEMD